MGVFVEDIINFYAELDLELQSSSGVSVMNPFKSDEVMKLCKWYHEKFYNREGKRAFLFGINPGRHGAGITGIPFTDPIQIAEMGYPNEWKKRHELSAVYVQELISNFGGLNKFAKQFYISSVCPLGFIKDGKNINYYDQADLQSETKAFIIESIKKQIQIGARTDYAFSLGKGKNFKYLDQLNKEEGFFDNLIALPHPRWVMQYKLKMKEHFIQNSIDKLRSVL